jgi:hypothetical protein
LELSSLLCCLCVSVLFCCPGTFFVILKALLFRLLSALSHETLLMHRVKTMMDALNSPSYLLPPNIALSILHKHLICFEV